MSAFWTELEVTPCADGESWRLNAEFRYSSTLLASMGGDGAVIVPKRFVTDFASVPKVLWALYPPWGRYGAAAVVHDWLYFSQGCSRETADAVLREAMTVLDVDQESIDTICSGVRAFGQAAWDRNAAVKKLGYTRLASMAANPPYASAI